MDEPVALSVPLHNFAVVICSILLGFWFLRVLLRLRSVWNLHTALKNGDVIRLDGLSNSIRQIGMVSRAHLQQILTARAHYVVRKVPQLHLPLHAVADSLKLLEERDTAAPSAPDAAPETSETGAAAAQVEISHGGGSKEEAILELEARQQLRALSPRRAERARSLRLGFTAATSTPLQASVLYGLQMSALTRLFQLRAERETYKAGAHGAVRNKAPRVPLINAGEETAIPEQEERKHEQERVSEGPRSRRRFRKGGSKARKGGEASNHRDIRMQQAEWPISPQEYMGKTSTRLDIEESTTEISAELPLDGTMLQRALDRGRAVYPLALLLEPADAERKEAVDATGFSMAELCALLVSENAEGALVVRLDNQLVITPDQALELRDVYGLEHMNNVECAVCLSENKDIINLPCRHCCVCHECFEHVQGKCPVCRSQINSFLRFGFDEDYNPVQRSIVLELGNDYW